MLGTAVRDGCAPPRGCWEQNPGPLKNVQGLLTHELRLQPHPPSFKGAGSAPLAVFVTKGIRTGIKS